MRPVSDGLLSILRGPHRMCARARVVTGFQTGVNPTGVEIPIISGDVRYAASADVRATLDMETDPALWPKTMTDLLNPYGAEVFVERGVVKGSGEREWVAQGYYRIESVEQDKVPDGPVRITGKDRMAGIVDAKLESPHQFSETATVTDVFDQLILDVYPTATIEYDWSAAAELLHDSHVVEKDRYDFINQVVTALGKICYWDHRGILVVKEPPLDTEPVWDITHGANGVLVELSRQRSREGVFNAAVVTGERAGTDMPPVWAAVRDTSTTSPTRWGGPFGKVPGFFSSSLITNYQGAANAARKKLAKIIGIPYSVNFSAVPNHALEPYDPVRVSYSDDARVEVHVLDELVIPLVARQAMTAKTRDISGRNLSEEELEL